MSNGFPFRCSGEVKTDTLELGRYTIESSPCACVHVRVCLRVCVRMHACSMRGCVCACVVGPTCARVHACLRARARMRRVHVHARSRASARARKFKCPHEGMRLYMCVGVRGYKHV